MAQHVLNIPTTTLPVGQTTTATVNVSANVTGTISIDRTVAGGLNSLTSATTLDAALEQSPDGVTWGGLVDGGQWTGGSQTDGHGQPLNANTLFVSGIAPDTAHIRGVLTVGGPSSVVIAGTVTIN